MPSTRTIRKQSLLSAGLLIIANLIFALPNTVSAMTITKMEPDTGVITGGNRIVIRGQGFMKTENESFDDVAAGVNHALLLSRNGHVWAVGSNRYNQLGTGRLSTRNEITPVDITDSFNLDSDDYIYRVAAGDYHSLAISINGRVFAWGKNSYGQLGNGNANDSARPVEITNNFPLNDDDQIEVIYAGPDTSFAVSAKGKAFGWGDAAEARMPDNEEKYAYYTTPRDITPLLDSDGSMKGMAVGNRIAIARLTGHGKELVTWGRNDVGQMGSTAPGQANYTNEFRASAFPIINNFDLGEDDEIESVEAGNDTMAALSKTGEVYIWGSNQRGVLGVGDSKPNPKDNVTGSLLSSTPINITSHFHLPGNDRVDKISLGNSHAMALTLNNQVYAWGVDSFGQIGNGADSEIIKEPTNITDKFKLPQGDRIKTVLAAGKADDAVASYSYAVDTAGRVYAWGGDRFGQPGINAVLNQTEPTVISDRLAVDVPGINQITFGDQMVDDYAVIDDKTIIVTVPEGREMGRVDVNVISDSGETVSAGNYTYTALPIIDDKGDEGDEAGNNGIDGNGDNAQTDVEVDGSKSDDKAEADKLKANADGNKSDSNLNDVLSTSAKFKVAAPNTSAEL